MPSARFLHEMGVASIVAGVVLIAMAAIVKRSPRLQRMRLGSP